MLPNLLKAVLRRWNQFGSLDRLVLLSSLVLAGLVIAVIAVGDRVGVRIQQSYPHVLALETSQISFRFSESMDRSSVADRFTSDPKVEGEVTWRRDRMVFQPRAKLNPGTEYRFTIRRGAQGQSGREVLEDYEITILVSDTVLLFKRPNDEGIDNIWAADPAEPETATQLTYSPAGIGEFAPSPDGRKIAFTERDATSGNFGLRLLDLDSGGLSTLTDSRQADAFNPTWHPDGTIVAFDRVERPGETTIRVPIPLVWAVDLFTTPPTERRLIASAEVPGYSPKWSSDGRRIAWGADSPQSSGPGVFVYDFIAAEFDFYDTLLNTLQTFSNDGRQLAFPVTDSTAGGVETTLRIADVETGDARVIDLPGQPAGDNFLTWSQDDQTIALVVRDRAGGLPGPQTFLLDLATSELTSVMVSAAHDTTSVDWGPSGSQLAVGRTLRWAADGTVLAEPAEEVWVYDTATGESHLVQTDATSPKWLP